MKLSKIFSLAYLAQSYGKFAEKYFAQFKEKFIYP